MAVRQLPLFGADITLCSILFCEMKIKFSIYAQNLKLHIMFDDVHWWFMFSNYRCTVAFCLPFWCVRSAKFTKLCLFALSCLSVCLSARMLQLQNRWIFMTVLKSCWAVSYISVELKTDVSEVSFVSIIRMHVVNGHASLIHIYQATFTWKTTFISVLKRRNFSRHKV
jgi:hypothetical protein